MHVECKNVLITDCSKKVHKKLNLDYQKTNDCVAESFSTLNGKRWGEKGVTNKLIDAEIKYMKDYGTYIYPSIVINNRTYRG